MKLVGKQAGGCLDTTLKKRFYRLFSRFIGEVNDFFNLEYQIIKMVLRQESNEKKSELF